MIRFGILSTAKIAGDFLRGVRSSRRLTVVAVGSRDATRATRFAREHGIATTYGSYEDLLADPSIDAIYNPLPNSLHAQWSIRALQAGKHVLCEKPLALNAAEARSMFDVAAKEGRHLVEGYPYLAQPLTTQMRNMLAAGEIGRIESIRAAFGFPMPDADNIRLDAGLGGGALMDAGCYPVSLVRIIAGRSPTRVSAAAQWTASGVDRALVANLEFDDGLLAQISCNFGTAVHRHATIAGTLGYLETNFLNTPPPDHPARMQIKRGTSWSAPLEAVDAPTMSGFLAEAESFCDLLTRGPTGWTGATREESIDIARMLDAIKLSARSGITQQL